MRHFLHLKRWFVSSVVLTSHFDARAVLLTGKRVLAQIPVPSMGGCRWLDCGLASRPCEASSSFSKVVKMNHQGSCKGSGVHNLLKIGTYFQRGTCACCEIPPTCITCSLQAVFYLILRVEFVCWLPFLKHRLCFLCSLRLSKAKALAKARAKVMGPLVAKF